jgi:hypothetical protein
MSFTSPSTVNMVFVDFSPSGLSQARRLGRGTTTRTQVHLL